MTGGGFGVLLLGLKVFPVVIVGGLDSFPGTIAIPPWAQGSAA